jgi:hypothetical protein
VDFVLHNPMWLLWKLLQEMVKVSPDIEPFGNGFTNTVFT